jgi:hypothetical protein
MIFSENNENHGMKNLKLTKNMMFFISKQHPEIKKKIRNGLIAILTEPDVGKNLKEDLA